MGISNNIYILRAPSPCCFVGSHLRPQNPSGEHTPQGSPPGPPSFSSMLSGCSPVVTTAMPYSLDVHGVSSANGQVLFKICTAILSPLHFCSDFTITLSISTPNSWLGLEHINLWMTSQYSNSWIFKIFQFMKIVYLCYSVRTNSWQTCFNVFLCVCAEMFISFIRFDPGEVIFLLLCRWSILNLKF